MKKYEKVQTSAKHWKMYKKKDTERCEKRLEKVREGWRRLEEVREG